MHGHVRSRAKATFVAIETRKPIYDFLLVINCHLSCISRRFQDIASRSRKPPHFSLSTRSRGAPSNFVFKLTVLTAETISCFALKIALSYFQLFCHNPLASQTTDRQTTDRRHTVTILCNVRLKTKPKCV